MKSLKVIIQIILITALPFTSIAQWIQVASGTTKHLTDTHFPTSNIGYAVGYSGTILKTIDAGNSWITLSTNKPFNLKAVTFIDANTGFVVGDSLTSPRGVLLKTTDGGNTWGQVNASKANGLNDIKFFNTQIGFCVGSGGSILKTVDGGSTWTSTVLTNTTQGGAGVFTSISLPTANIAYALRTGFSDYLVKTTDGGNTWSDVQLNSNSYANGNESVFFTDANTGYIGGWYFTKFIKTTDGGTNWVNCNSTPSTTPAIYSIYFPSSNIGYAVGRDAIFYKTSDGGNSWQIQNAPPSILTNEVFEAVYFTSITDGYIVGTNGIILKTNNGGVIGIGENSNKNINVNIFPNPTNGIINVEFGDMSGASAGSVTNAKIQIINVLGEVVMKEVITTNHLTLTTDHLTSGMYFVEILSGGNIIATQKIIMQ